MTRQDSGFRIQDSGFGIQDSGAERGVAHPESRALDPAVLQRMRWRCRRGLLELDIVLGRFVEQCYAGLDGQQQAAFDALLDMPDTVLWDMITGRGTPPQDVRQRELLEWLKTV